MSKFVKMAKFAVIGLGLSASAAFAAAPVQVGHALSAACCALGACCGADMGCC